LLGYALIGLAVMTKGPVGLVLPVGIVFCFHLLRGELGAAWRYYKPLGGFLLVGAISLPWFVTEIYLTKGAYYQEFLVRENFQRFTSVVDHKGAWWYHIAAVAGGFFPWTVFAPQALLAAFVRPAPAVRSDHPAAGGKASDQAGFIFFSALSFLTVLVFFSVSISKLLPYTLPGFPFLAALVAVYLDKALAQGKLSRVALPLTLVAIAAGVALYMVPHLIVRLREMPAELPVVIHQALLRLLVAAIAAILAVWFKRPHLGLTVFAAAVFVCFLTSGNKALNILGAEWEGPVPAFARFAALSGDPIVVWHMRKPSITFYAGRKVLIPADSTQLDETMKDLPRAYIIAKVADLPALSHLSDCRLLVKQGRFALLRRQAAASPLN
jgi:4-amino-4-deoxy-L-arabinose transferase-like glycosyltransferase